MFPRVAVFLAIFFGAVSLLGQNVDAKELLLLSQARERYYDLRTLGVKSFSCSIDTEWESFYLAANGSAPPNDDPTIQYLHTTRIQITDNLVSGPVAKWVGAGAPPIESKPLVDQMSLGIPQVVEEIFRMWTMSFNGGPIPEHVESLVADSRGYVIHGRPGTNDLDEMTFDKHFQLTHIRSKLADSLLDAQTTFLPLPQGFLLSAVDGDYHEPPTAPARHVVMKMDFQYLHGYWLPLNFSFDDPRSALTLHMRAEDCTVQK